MKKLAKILSIVVLGCFPFTTYAATESENLEKTATTKVTENEVEEEGIIIPRYSFTKGIKLGGKIKTSRTAVFRKKNNEIKYPTVSAILDATASIPVGNNTIEIRIAPEISMKPGINLDIPKVDRNIEYLEEFESFKKYRNQSHPAIAHAYADYIFNNKKVRIGYTDVNFDVEGKRALQAQWIHEINDNFNYALGFETTNAMYPEMGKQYRGIPGTTQKLQYKNDRFDITCLGLVRYDLIKEPSKDKKGKKVTPITYSTKFKWGVGGKLLTDVVLVKEHLKIKTKILGGVRVGEYIGPFVTRTIITKPKTKTTAKKNEIKKLDNAISGAITVETYYIPEKLQCDLSYTFSAGGDKWKIFKKHSEGGWKKKHEARVKVFYHFVHKKIKLGISSGINRLPAGTDKGGKDKGKNEFPVCLSAKFEF